MALIPCCSLSSSTVSGGPVAADSPTRLERGGWGECMGTQKEGEGGPHTVFGTCSSRWGRIIPTIVEGQ